MSPATIDARRASSPSTQIVARRVDLRESFTQTHVRQSGNQRLASGVLILSSLAGLALTVVGHL